MTALLLSSLQLRELPCPPQQQAWQGLHPPPPEPPLPRSGQTQRTFPSSDPQILASYPRLAEAARLVGYPRGQEVSLIDSYKRQFQCPYCEQKMTSKGSLVRHIRSHTGERPYKCSYCSYAALQKSDLDRHARNRHRDQL